MHYFPSRLPFYISIPILMICLVGPLCLSALRILHIFRFSSSLCQRNAFDKSLAQILFMFVLENGASDVGMFHIRNAAPQLNSLILKGIGFSATKLSIIYYNTWDSWFEFLIYNNLGTYFSNQGADSNEVKKKKLTSVPLRLPTVTVNTNCTTWVLIQENLNVNPKCHWRPRLIPRMADLCCLSGS